MSRYHCLIFVASLTLVGCDMAGKQDAQYDDARNPYYKQAALDVDTDPAKAAQDYQMALAANPKLIAAHYQLGHLYAEKLNEPNGAIFHLQQFLKLAPTSDKADEVKALLDKESQVFSASLSNTPVQTTSAEELAKLQADNASLKKQLDQSNLSLAELKTSYNDLLGKFKEATTPKIVAPAPAPVIAGTDGTVPVAVPAEVTPLSTNFLANATNPPPVPAAAPGAPSRTYKIVKGDKLWTIAHKMYPGGNTKENVEKIQEANKDAIGGKPLKIGQVLILP